MFMSARSAAVVTASTEALPAVCDSITDVIRRRMQQDAGRQCVDG